MRPAKTSAIHFASQIGITGAGFLATVYFTRSLGATDYGSFVLVLALLYWLIIPSSAINSALVKRVSEGTTPRALLSAGFLTNLALAGILVAAILVASRYITAYVHAPVAGLLAALVATKILFGTVAAGLKGQLRVARSGTLRLLERLLRIAAQVTLLFLAFGVAGLIVGNVLSLLVASAIGLWLYETWFSRPHLHHIKRLLNYARYSWLGSVKSRVLGPAIDVLLLQAIVGSTALVSIYQISWYVASIPVLLSISIRETIFPEISGLATDGNDARIRNLLGDGLIFTGLFVIPGFLGAIALSERILHIFGDTFTRGAGILLILILARGVAAYASQLTNALNAIDRPDLGFRLNLLFLVTNVGLDIVLIPLFSWYGAAAATAIAATVSLGVNYRITISQLNHLNLQIGEFGRQLLAALVMYGVVRGAQATLPLPVRSDWATIGFVVLGAGVYGVTLLAVSPWTRSKTLSLLPYVRSL